MKVDKTELQIALEKVKPGLANKDLIEQTTSFAFIKGTVVTYNDEISISHPVAGLEEITAAIKAHALYEFLNKIKKGEIYLEWQDSQLVITAGRTKAGLVLEQEVKLPLEEVQNFPKWRALPDGFLEAVRLSVPCCSKDMSRPVLTCVHIDGDKVEGTDSYQILRYTLDNKIPGGAFLLPANSAKILTQYQVKHISKGDSWVHFRTEDGTIFSSRIVADNFPDTTKYLDVSGEQFTFPETFPTALERAQVFAKSTSTDTAYVIIEVKQGVVQLSAKNEYGWFEEQMKTKQKDVSFKIHVGISFLLNLFEKLQTCTIAPGRIGLRGDRWQHVIATMAEAG